jgi:hypothetical protein
MPEQGDTTDGDKACLMMSIKAFICLLIIAGPLLGGLGTEKAYRDDDDDSSSVEPAGMMEFAQRLDTLQSQLSESNDDRATLRHVVAQLSTELSAATAHIAETVANGKNNKGKVDNPSLSDLSDDDDDSSSSAFVPPPFADDDDDECTVCEAEPTPAPYTLFHPRTDYTVNDIMESIDRYVSYITSNSTHFYVEQTFGTDYETNIAIPFHKNVARFTVNVHEQSAEERVRTFFVLCLGVEYKYSQLSRDSALVTDVGAAAPWLSDLAERVETRTRLLSYVQHLLDSGILSTINPSYHISTVKLRSKLRYEVALDSGVGTFYESLQFFDYAGPYVLGHNTVESYFTNDGKLLFSSMVPLFGALGMNPTLVYSYEFKPEMLRSIPTMLHHDAQRMRVLADHEERGARRYVAHALTFFPQNLTSLLKPVDAEGYAPPAGFTPDAIGSILTRVRLERYLPPDEIQVVDTLSSSHRVMTTASSPAISMASPILAPGLAESRMRAKARRSSKLERVEMRKRQLSESNSTNPSYSGRLREVAVMNGAFGFTLNSSVVSGSHVIGIRDTLHIAAPTVDEAEVIIAEIERVWDDEVRHEMRRIGLALRDKLSNLVDDDYPGFWRNRLFDVLNVTRNATTGEMIDFATYVYTPDLGVGLDAGNVLVTVPVDPSQIQLYASEMAAREPTIHWWYFMQMMYYVHSMIDEMENAYRNSLMGLHMTFPGDEFVSLRKKNPLLGRSTEYTDVGQVFDNYEGDLKVIDESDYTIIDAMVESGDKFVEFFDDAKRVVARKFIKAEYALFNFSSAQDADIDRVNNNGVLVDLALAIDNANSVGNARSDIEVLGRHYGYMPDGTIKADEWENGELIYRFRNDFHYIYRQHYMYDTSAPLTATNVRDPQTGKFKYQGTDAGDEVRQKEHEDAFLELEATSLVHVWGLDESANRRGTFYRFQYDWVLQNLGEHVVRNAVDLGLYTANFSANYLDATFVNTHNYNGTPSVYNERFMYRVIGQLTGSAAADVRYDWRGSAAYVLTKFTTFTPVRAPASDLSTILHEGPLGHGFEWIPGFFQYLRTFEVTGSWVVVGSVVDETYVSQVGLGIPGYGMTAEGWATYGEFLAHVHDLFVVFDSDGKIAPPSPQNQNYAAALYGLVDGSRIAIRRSIDPKLNSAKYGYTLNRVMKEFTEASNLNALDAATFFQRFAGSPGQQTTYASGMISNMAISSEVKRVIASDPAHATCTFSQAKMVELRVMFGSEIVGVSPKVIAENYFDNLVSCGPQ